MRGDAGDIDIGRDAASIGAGRVVERHAAGARLWRQGEAARHVALLRSGRFRLTASTVYGDYTVAEMQSPCLVGLPEILAGGGRFASLEAAGEGESVRVGESETRVLLSGRTPASAAFRRLAIGVPLLLRFGLVERTYPEGARLTRTGEAAIEAFLTYSGSVRISIKIPGVGEEALSILGPGEIMGEMGLVDDSVRSAYVIAHGGPATVFVMTRPVFRRLLTSDAEGSPPLVARIASSLASRLEEAAARAVSFFVLSGGAGSQPPEGGFDFDDDVEGLFPGS